MMEKLELKHIAPYLPYGLKIEPIYKSMSNRGFYIRELDISVLNDYDIEEIKPILRPLSDLDKEIEVDGERFVPKKVLGIFHDVSGNNLLNFRTGERINILSLPFLIIQKMIEWHFDVSGLIPQNLAIDINTLEK